MTFQILPATYSSMKYLILFVFAACNTLEKEKLDLEKARLDFEKEKMSWEKEKGKCGSCCPSPCEKTDCRETVNEPAVILVHPKTVQTENPVKETTPKLTTNETIPCERIAVPSLEDIWALSVEGGWSHHPEKISTNNVCRGDLQEYFYKQYSNNESYVAEKHVPRTRKSSCTNNVLFHGKDKLYNLMIEKTAKEEAPSASYDLESVKKDVVTYNTEGKKRSFFYECRPTDPQKRWDTCTCVLYSTYRNGKSGLSERIKK